MNDRSPRRAEIRNQLGQVAELAEAVARDFSGPLEALADRIVDCFAGGGKLLFAGNGGSAAAAQHLAAEYVVRFARGRRALPAMALTSDSSVLTAAANDNGFETVFSRQVEAFGTAGDLLLLYSTSGASDNLLEAAAVARRLGVTSVAFLARDGGPLKGMVDQAFVVPTDVTARAQELHVVMGHVVCDLVEREFQDGSEG